MTANKPYTGRDWTDPDDAPDLSTPEFSERIAAAPVKRGRPKSDAPKVLTTIRLDADIVARFREKGAGWQSRINEALREWLTAH